MQATISSNSSGATTAHQPAYQPSVPITVYRQLATELQNTKERLTNLEIEHKKLTSQNQALQLEFSAIANANQQIQNLVLKSANEVQAIGQNIDQRLQTLLTVSPAKFEQKPEPKSEVIHPKSAPVKLESAKPELAKSQVALPFEVKPTSESTKKNAAKTAQNTAQSKSEPKSGTKAEVKSEQIKLHTEEPSVSIASEAKDTNIDRGLSGWWLSLTVICIVLISFGAGYLLMKPFASRN